jgi:molecular chaperone GrpE
MKVPIDEHDKNHDRKHHGQRRHGPPEHASDLRGATDRAGGEPAKDAPPAEEHAGRVHSRPEHHKAEQDLAAERDKLATEVSEIKDRYLRALADFENYRKRVARDNEERTRCATEDLVGRLLDVIDNMERAVDASAEAKDFDGLRKGLELTYASLRDILAKEGLCPIKCVGERFDPNYHEAIMTREQAGMADDNVLEEIQKGYTLKGKVIRPSKVVVSK